MRRTNVSVFIFSAILSACFVTAQSTSQPSCDASTKCPADLPCCSQYGVCGIGSYCLGGCDPRFSYQIDSCMPAPQCVNKTYTFDNISSSFTDYSTYLGNQSTGAEWTYSGYPLQYGSNALLTMPANSAGTVIMSTNYVWYAKVSATIKTSRDQGVVTAFIFLSDVKDEIDYEWVGADLTTAQTNIYWQADPYYGNSANISNLNDTFTTWHTYTVDWQADQIIWSVDGTTYRTKTRASTWNSTSQLYNYPQTPSRIEISLWPGGASDQAPGTIAWAGGAINWSSQDIQSNGYYYMQVQDVTVECYDPPAGTPKDGSGTVSYVFDNTTTTFLNNSVILSDKGTVLLSQLGSGTNTSAAPPPGSSASSLINPSQGASDGGGSADGDRGGDGSNGGTSSPASSSSGGTSFNQGVGSGGKSDASNLHISRLVALWSGMIGLIIAGMFTLL